MWAHEGLISRQYGISFARREFPLEGVENSASTGILKPGLVGMRAVPVPEVGEADVREREPRPHYHGHRQRLRERLFQAGADALPDYEIL